MENVNRIKTGPPTIVKAISFVVIITSTFYAIRNRSIKDFLEYSSYIFISLLVIISVIIVFSVGAKFRDITKHDFLYILLGLIVIALSSPIYYSIAVGFRDLYYWVQAPSFSNNWTILFVLAFTITLGFILFFFRLYARSIYGLTEALVGLGVAVQKVSSEINVDMTKSSFYLVILTASVYLFVRGLDNIHQGFTKEPLDPYAKKIYNFFSTIDI